MYNTPTPYLRVWRSSGEVLTLDEVQALLDGNSGHNKTSDNPDARHYEFGKLVMESHPFLDSPYCSLHVCVLEDRLNSIMSTEVDDSLYLLVWLSVIGPFIGLPVSASAFITARDLLLQRK